MRKAWLVGALAPSVMAVSLVVPASAATGVPRGRLGDSIMLSAADELADRGPP